eukprot:CAMPEP_0172586058 /NCGR_PEP_ID=MMETSP1068-20121228/5453_1 /TAXON_ID=35684 /ORGANISM="Pseudopedinella elastica, Strain CCMP716" /LENGTH=41 /DNA_ID= /DNA_START= /DNA_END= /DNA_ORIENTATION=
MNHILLASRALSSSRQDNVEFSAQLLEGLHVEWLGHDFIAT